MPTCIGNALGLPFLKYTFDLIKIFPVKYGALYNWYAATDVRNIANAGWEVASKIQFTTLVTYLTNNGYGYEGSGNDVAKSICDTQYWQPSATLGTPGNDILTNNTAKYNLRGHGIREYNTGNFSSILTSGHSWTSTYYGSYSGELSSWSFDILNSVATTQYSIRPLKTGLAIRLIKTTTILTNGQSGTYTGNDGKVYRTICIGTQEWLADNLYETKFRTGADITVVTDNSAWAALTTEGMCYYNNDINNA